MMPPTQRVPVTVRMPRYLCRRLHVLAERRKISLNELMVELMENTLKEADDGA